MVALMAEWARWWWDCVPCLDHVGVGCGREEGGFVRKMFGIIGNWVMKANTKQCARRRHDELIINMQGERNERAPFFFCFCFFGQEAGKHNVNQMYNEWHFFKQHHSFKGGFVKWPYFRANALNLMFFLYNNAHIFLFPEIENVPSSFLHCNGFSNP